MIRTQQLAAATVERVLSGASLTTVLQETWRSHRELSDQQRGAIQDLSYGVLRFYGQLDILLGLLLNKPLKDQGLRYLLLVGLYQLQYSKTAPHVVVDSAVSASCTPLVDSWNSRNIRDPRHAKSVGGLVNAILRNFLRKRPALLEQTAATEVGRYSHPQWWIDKLHGQYPSRYQAVLESANKRPPMTLRINRRRTNVEAYQSLLSDSGMNARWAGSSWAKDALELSHPVAVEKLPGFSQGLISVQDVAAQLAAPLLRAQDSMRVLDACAAPGGKSAHLLELADLELIAVDNDGERVERLKQNFTRLGLKPHRIIQGDATRPGEWWDGRPFDRILADVPCSASGVVRRHPDIKWLRRESDLGQFAEIQRKTLDALWQTLVKGGKLLYVTCSIFAEENGIQVEGFLNRHPDARLLPLSVPEIVDGQLLPDSHHDGFFYALLEKF
jgi:16S rRNA (cytosine967-C5)-methyltransferase